MKFHLDHVILQFSQIFSEILRISFSFHIIRLLLLLFCSGYGCGVPKRASADLSILIYKEECLFDCPFFLFWSLKESVQSNFAWHIFSSRGRSKWSRRCPGLGGGGPSPFEKSGKCLFDFSKI